MGAVGTMWQWQGPWTVWLGSPRQCAHARFIGRSNPGYGEQQQHAVVELSPAVEAPFLALELHGLERAVAWRDAAENNLTCSCCDKPIADDEKAWHEPARVGVEILCTPTEPAPRGDGYWTCRHCFEDPYYAVCSICHADISPEGRTGAFKPAAPRSIAQIGTPASLGRLGEGDWYCMPCALRMAMVVSHIVSGGLNGPR